LIYRPQNDDSKEPREGALPGPQDDEIDDHQDHPDNEIQGQQDDDPQEQHNDVIQGPYSGFLNVKVVTLLLPRQSKQTFGQNGCFRNIEAVGFNRQ
jgi:hypothetical protein